MLRKQPDIMISATDLAVLEQQLENSPLPRELARAIEHEIDRATIVPFKDLPENVVALGSHVTFKIQNTQQTFTKTLCLPANVSKFEDSISIFAPIGSALLGLKTGQSIQWETQRGLQSVKIIQVNNDNSTNRSQRLDT